MGRKRKPPEEQKETVFVSLPLYVIEKLKKEGNPRKVIEKIIMRLYGRKDKS